MRDGVQTPVYSAAVVALIAEILPERPLLIVGDMDRVVHEFLDAFAVDGRNRDHGNAQQRFQLVDVDGSAVAPDLVHHIEGDDHGDVHFQQLHGQIEVALNIGRVHDVDDGAGLLLQDKIPGDQLLAAVGRHGINARQVRDQRIGAVADRPVLAADGHAGKVAHVLVGSGQLVEERCLATVLIADQCKSQERVIRKRISVTGTMEAARLTQAGVFRLSGPDDRLDRFAGETGIRVRAKDIFFNRIHKDLPGVRDAERELIAVDPQLHGIPQRGQLGHGDIISGQDAHIQEMLAQGTLAADLSDDRGLSRGNLL